MKSYKYSFLLPLLFLFQIFLVPEDLSLLDSKDKIETGISGVVGALPPPEVVPDGSSKLFKKFPLFNIPSIHQKKIVPGVSSQRSVPEYLSHLASRFYLLQNYARAPPVESFKLVS